MAKQRTIVKLASTESSGVFYTTTVNKKLTQMKGKGKLSLKKYDKKLRKHVEFKEEKA